MTPKTRIPEAAQSTTLIGANVIAQLLRDLPENERNALRDYYAAEGDEQQICARHSIPPEAFQNLKRTLRAQFRAQSPVQAPVQAKDLRSSLVPKTAKSFTGAWKATLRRIA